MALERPSIEGERPVRENGNGSAEKRQVMHAFGPYLMQEKNEQLVSYIQKEQQKFTKILKMIEQHQSSSDEAVSRKKMLDLAAAMLDLA